MVKDSKFLVYRASAGSGKTFTLVKEYLCLALADTDPIRFRKILAITFTNKAATEMKERVISQLHDLTVSPEDAGSTMKQLLLEELGISPQELRKRAGNLLGHILHQYNDFSVGTIDSFMYRVVRAFAQELRLPVSFTVELSSDVLIQMAVDELLKKIGDDDAITETLVAYIRHQANEEKKASIETELADAAKDLLAEQQADIIATLAELEIHDLLKIRNNCLQDCKNIEAELRRLGLDALKAIDESGIDGNELYRGKGGIFNWFKKLPMVKSNGLPDISNYVRESIYDDIWLSKAKEREPIASVIAVLAQNHLRPIALKAAELIEENRADYNLKNLLKDELYNIALLNEISKIFNRIRFEEGIIHISDFNKRVGAIVMDEPVPFIYERLGERYQHFMIDEFQDTSVMQWQNLLPLVQNGLSQNALSLIVGDGKQAIYRFRGGEVGLFSALPEPYSKNASELTIERHKLLKQMFGLRNLNQNFRSGSAIVEFNNKLYNFLAENHLPSHFIPVYKELSQKTSGNEEMGYVQIEWLPEGQKSEQREEENKIRCLNIIHDLIEIRGFSYRDIAILVRSNRKGAVLAEYLVEQGVPVISGEALMIDSSPEVSLILACLNVIAGRNVNLNLYHICSWLISKRKIPFDTLESFKRHIGKLNENNLFDFLHEQGYSLRFTEKGGASIYEICNRIIRMFDIKTQEDPYVLFFMESVWVRSGKSVTDCAVFLDWWEEYKKSQSLKLPESADAVKIMSIHKSKGLQFPVVIFPFVNGQKSDFDPIWVRNDGHLPYKLPIARLPMTSKALDQTYFSFLLQEEKDKTILDIMNLMYVATTRPEQALYIISGISAASSTKNKGWEAFLKDFLEAETKEELQTGTFTWGDSMYRKPVSTKKKEVVSGTSVPSYPIGDWRERILFSRRSEKVWQDDNSAIVRGNILHSAMEHIHSESDISYAMERLIQGGLIAKSERALLEIKVRELIALPEICQYFKSGLKIRNERELLLPDGTVIRPDRVVQTDHCFVVIDYKTGKPEQSHHRQVKKYMEQLDTLGNGNTRGYLVYLHEPLHVELVNKN